MQIIANKIVNMPELLRPVLFCFHFLSLAISPTYMTVLNPKNAADNLPFLQSPTQLGLFPHINSIRSGFPLRCRARMRNHLAQSERGI